MTLWFLLEAGSSAAFVAGALAAARLAHAKIIGYAAVLSLGFLLALLNGWAVDRVGRYSYRSAQCHSVRRQEWSARAAYFGLFVWICVALFLGVGVSGLVLRAIGNAANLQVKL
ncbi:MAG TPA: hypothetical protein VKB48_13560 [Candidatus Acidoferrum sp.]|nr:hypothetical protein [Candidatus Acidoferrum sp.]